ILDDETAMIAFEADKSVSEAVGTTPLKATLTITPGAGSSGTTGLDQTLTVVADNTTGGTATLGTDYGFTTSTLTFATGNTATVDSTTGTLTVVNDSRLEGNETANFTLGSLNTTLNGA